jgi:hypothetical protein
MQTYEIYVARCHTEDLTPFSIEAWELIRHPMTIQSMNRAWNSTLRMRGGWGTRHGNWVHHEQIFRETVDSFKRVG